MSAWAPTGERTEDLVHAIRDHRTETVAGTGVAFEVTGTTALNIDVEGEALSRAHPTPRAGTERAG